MKFINQKIYFQDPGSAIPKGTMLALLISMISYALFVVFAGGSALRDASGSVNDLANGVLTSCVQNNTCQYGLFNSYQVHHRVIFFMFSKISNNDSFFYR